MTSKYIFLTLYNLLKLTNESKVRILGLLSTLHFNNFIVHGGHVYVIRRTREMTYHTFALAWHFSENLAYYWLHKLI